MKDYACVDWEKMADIAIAQLRQVQLEQKIRQNNVKCMKLLQRLQALPLACPVVFRNFRNNPFHLQRCIPLSFTRGKGEVVWPGETRSKFWGASLRGASMIVPCSGHRKSDIVV